MNEQETKQEIDWRSGDLSKYVGRYIPNIEGTAVITLNTRKDPEGRIYGTMPCVRIREGGAAKDNRQ